MSHSPTPSVAPSERTRLRRQPQRGDYAPETVRAILDEARICQLAFCQNDQPHVIPTFYALWKDEIVLHGSTANRALRALAKGGEACVSVSIVDALVLARSALHHSMNFRSVTIYGRARKIDDPGEKVAAFRALIENLVPGRWNDIRPPNEIEDARTLVLAIPLSEASAKIRSAPPVDDEPDHALDCWAGLLPLPATLGEPIPDPRLRAGIPVPKYVSDYLSRHPRAVAADRA